MNEAGTYTCQDKGRALVSSSLCLLTLVPLAALAYLTSKSLDRSSVLEWFVLLAISGVGVFLLVLAARAPLVRLEVGDGVVRIHKGVRTVTIEAQHVVGLRDFSTTYGRMYRLALDDGTEQLIVGVGRTRARAADQLRHELLEALAANGASLPEDASHWRRVSCPAPVLSRERRCPRGGGCALGSSWTLYNADVVHTL